MTTHNQPSLIKASDTMPPTLIIGNVEGIDQALALLDLVSDDHYQHIAKPYVQSSIGAHLRHIIDMYFSVMSYSQPRGSMDEILIDYDARRRGALVEVCRQTAIQELQLIKSWLRQLSQSDLSRLVTIQTEISIYQQHVCQMTSSLQRELLFVASHTTHHFSLIRAIAQDCQIETDTIFSYAPATASYLRGLG